MNNDSDELMDGDEQPGEGRSESEVVRLVRDCRRETGSLFHRDKVKHIDINDQLFVKMTKTVDGRG